MESLDCLWTLKIWLISPLADNYSLIECGSVWRILAPLFYLREFSKKKKKMQKFMDFFFKKSGFNPFKCQMFLSDLLVLSLIILKSISMRISIHDLSFSFSALSQLFPEFTSWFKNILAHPAIKTSPWFCYLKASNPIKWSPYKVIFLMY